MEQTTIDAYDVQKGILLAFLRLHSREDYPRSVKQMAAVPFWMLRVDLPPCEHAWTMGKALLRESHANLLRYAATVDHPKANAFLRLYAMRLQQLTDMIPCPETEPVKLYELN